MSNFNDIEYGLAWIFFFSVKLIFEHYYNSFVRILITTIMITYLLIDYI